MASLRFLRRRAAPLLVATVLALAARPLGAQSAVSPLRPLRALAGSRFVIRGSTTIGSLWRCVATEFTAVAVIGGEPNAGPADNVSVVSVYVPVRALRCESQAMDRAMLRAMRAEGDSASVIIGTFAARPAGSGAVPRAHLEGTLTVAGVERPVAVDIDVRPGSSTTFRVETAIPLTLTSFHIEPPRALLGLIRARDAITVDVDLLFAR